MPANRDARKLKRQRSCADGTELILVASPRDFVTEVQTPPTVPIGTGKSATLPLFLAKSVAVTMLQQQASRQPEFWRTTALLLFFWKNRPAELISDNYVSFRTIVTSRFQSSAFGPLSSFSFRVIFISICQCSPRDYETEWFRVPRCSKSLCF
jgi:hypothetical protein